MKKVQAFFVVLVMLLTPALARAELFYLTQGLGCQSWVVALSKRSDAVELCHRAYGDGVIPGETLRTFAKAENISFWEAA